MNSGYVHGHHLREHARLRDQAFALVDLLHSDTVFPPGSRVLEAGCGVGAQTVTLAHRSPRARITAFDVSGASLKEARRRAADAGAPDVRFLQADINSPPFPPRLVYVDASRPELFEGFTRKTFTAMIEGVRRQAIEAGLTEEQEFDRGIADLCRTAEPGGTFCYTFFKAVGRSPER